MGNKGRWKDGRYIGAFRLWAATTNKHVQFYPLRDEDGEYYWTMRSHLYLIGKDLRENWKKNQERYLNKRPWFSKIPVQGRGMF